MIAYVVLLKCRKTLLFQLMHSFRYPVSNAILIIPLSVVRWVQLTGSRPIRTGGSIAAQTIFDLNGLVNVLLLVYLRPGLFQGGEPIIAGEGAGVAKGAGDDIGMESTRTQNESSSVLDRQEVGPV
jgi:hypothetical protein